MSRTIRVEHLARVEGHGGIAVDLDGDTVSVHFDIFEGARLLEQFVRGRSHQDVPQILSRICAICSAVHTLTSIKAIEDAFDVRVSQQTEQLRELMLLGENIESHALHLFLLALPDYLGYPSAGALAADRPDAVKLGLRLKKVGNTIQEIIGGRAVHPVTAIPGGFSKAPTDDQLITLRRNLLDAVVDCSAAVDLFASFPPADFCHVETAYAAVKQTTAYGYYAGTDIGVTLEGFETTAPAHEYRDRIRETAVGHSHAKHSGWGGEPVMVGSLARLTVNEKLTNCRMRETATRIGLRTRSDNPLDNNKAQLVELVRDVEEALRTVEELLTNEIRDEAPVPVLPRTSRGTAVAEAPRGLVIHNYTFDGEGRVTSADVVTPTAINAASIERRLRRAVEQGRGVEHAVLVKRLEMIARAYDPCISCSVH